MDMRAVLAFPISYTLLPVTVTRLGPCRLCPLTINHPVSPLFFWPLSIPSHQHSASHQHKEALATFQLHFHRRKPSIQDDSTITSHQQSKCSTHPPSSWPSPASLPLSPPHQAQQPLRLLLTRNLAAALPLMRTTLPPNREAYKG